MSGWEFKIVTVNEKAGIVRSQFVYNVEGRREIGATTSDRCRPEFLERVTQVFHNHMLGQPASND